VTQQLIDDMRLTPETEMLNDVKSYLAEDGTVGWRGSFGETLVSIEFIEFIEHTLAAKG